MDGVKEYSRKEMIEMARETRKNVTNAPVSREELEQYPIYMEKLMVPTRVGDSSVYYSYAKEAADSDVLLLNFHGGGFIRERTPNDELFCRRLNHTLGCKVMDVDYRIAPEHPYPEAVHETYDVLQWVYQNRKKFQIDGNKIILLGHSAGGNLATVAVMQALANQTFCPAGLITEYPPMDIFTDPAEKVKMGDGIPAERARLYNLYYCDRELQKEPYVSPVYAKDSQLEGFPPSLFITAELDDLCTEAEDFALRLARMGNEVTLKRFQGTGHAQCQLVKNGLE